MFVRAALLVGVVVHLLAATSVACASIFPLPMESTASPDRALVILNQYRGAAGLSPVREMVDDWNRRCEHGPGVISDSGRNPTVWDDSVYHRLPVLNPRLVRSGWRRGCLWVQNEGAVSDAPDARTAEMTPYVWPPRGSTDAPWVVTGGEFPYSVHDVVEAVTGAAHTVGYPLSVQFNGPWGEARTRVEADSATLTGPAGSVDLIVQDGRQPVIERFQTPTQFLLQGALVLIPVFPLRPLTAYTAQAQGTLVVTTAEGERRYPFSVHWAFRTGEDWTQVGPVDTAPEWSTRIIGLAPTVTKRRLLARGISVSGTMSRRGRVRVELLGRFNGRNILLARATVTRSVSSSRWHARLRPYPAARRLLAARRGPPSLTVTAVPLSHALDGTGFSQARIRIR